MRKYTVNIQVKIIKENDDGSANAQVDFDKQGLETLVQWGLVAMLTKAIDEYRVRPEENSQVVIKRSKPAKAKPVEKKKVKNG